MRLGVVELSTRPAQPGEVLPQLSGWGPGEVAWYSSARELSSALTGTPVEAVVFHTRLEDQDELVEAMDQARSLNPTVKILLSTFSNELFMVAEINPLLVRHASRMGRPRSLTAREYQVLREIRSGHTRREIAGMLGISLSTVNRHVESILKKVSARNGAQAVAETRDLAYGAEPHLRESWEHAT